MNHEEVLSQSKNAYNAWADLWRENCSRNAKVKKIPMEIFKNKGNGKKCVCISMGASLEKDIEDLRTYQKKVDIFCVDKAFDALMKNGIKPDFVVIADAKVSYENYAEKWINQSGNVALIANVNCNPKWAENWKGTVTFYVNKDNINSENEFSALSGVYDQIPAGSNVSNALLIYASHVMKYDKYFLLGFDFSWDIGGKFYAFDNYSTKKYYLNQMRVPNRRADLVSTSENLWFSARWVEEWVNKMIGPERVVDCSDGILKIKSGELKNELSKISLYMNPLNDTQIGNVYTQTFVVQSDADFEMAKALLNDPENIVSECMIKYIKKGALEHAKGQTDKN